jgi:hypothetical protein
MGDNKGENQFRVNNKNINLKNYIYTDADNSYLYFDKSFSPKFIAQLLYLYTTFAYENGILDKSYVKKETAPVEDSKK